MKVKQVFLIFCITVLTAVYGFSADLKVISAKPKGTLNYAERIPVSVTFNQPVAALSEESAFAREDCPLQIIPAVAGTCRFSGTQTLQFEPEQDWTDATQYTVTLPGSFSSQVSKAQLAEDYRFSFTTQRPEVQEVIPYDKEQWIDVRPLIFVILNQPVNLASAQQAVRVTYPGKAAPQPGWWERLKAFFLGVDLNIRPAEIAVPVKVRPLTDQEFEEKFSYRKKNYIFVVELEKDLPSDTQITFSVSRALRGRSGNLGPEKDFISVFYTYPPLEIAGGNFKGCLPFESQIAFTSPVRLEELLKHIKVSPESVLTEVTEQEKQTLGYQYYATRRTAGEQEQGTIVALPEGKGYFAMPLSFLRLPPNEEVTITLDKNLADIYGQKLGADLTIRLRNNGYCPAVVFKDGTGVLESYLPLRHPIDVLNEAELEVSAGRFNRDNIIAFLEKDAHYCQEKEIAAADLQYKGKYQFEITEDKTKKTYLDLTRFHPTAHDSVIYSQVRLPSKYREEGYCWKGATDNITDMGVTLKTAQENMLVWVTSLKDGMPKAEAKVELRDGKNRILWTGITDKNGLAVAPGTKALSAQSRNSWSRPVIYAFVTSENGDAVLASDWNDGIEPWRFNLPFSYSNEPDNFKTALFTDRGIYRPGETVYVKGITRQQKQGEWVLPYLTQETVKVYNSREEEILKDTLKYTNKGSFDWKFNLPENAATGTWRIDTKENSYTFRVEAVKQADFEVHLRPLKNAFLSGEKAEFTASADYLFGAPVAKAKAKWNVRLADEWFHPTGYEEYEFEPYFLRRDEKSTEGLLAESSAELDEQGKLNFAVNLPKVTHRQNIYTELGVQAPTGQQLFARTNTTLNPADFYLGAHMERWATEVSEPVKTHLIAIDTEGKLTGGMQVKADIQKEEYFSVRKNGLAGRLEWVSERKTQAIGSQSFVMTEKGYDFSFVPEKPGNYLITLSAKDKQGREVRGGFSVMVYGKGESYWKQNDDDILILKQEKDKYNVGETARILVQSPYEKAMALITVERKGILDSWVKQINGGADYVDVPIKENYMPNVFVSVTLVHGRAEKAMYDKEGLDLAKPQAKIGYARLTVSQTEREIQTQVTPARTQYQPGEEVEVQLQTALQGKEVSAEVTVMAVDEGVLSLTGYKLPDLVKFFYQPQELNVSTADNHLLLIGQRNFGEKGENRGGGGGLSDKLGGADLRSHFEFTPYFNARVQTDAQGKAKIKFKLPDNLTTFRIMAVAATEKEFGAAEADIKVSKPLMITPKMPRFARMGDRFQCGAVVYNYDDNSAEFSVFAQADGAVSLTGNTHKIRVEKGGAKEVSWPCEALYIGNAQFKFSVKSTQSQDGVKLDFPVTVIEKKQILTLYSSTENTEEQLLEKPSSVNEQVSSEVNLSFASTALINLRGSMLYLLTYPYDCLEQKMSKILPVIEGAKLVEDFNLGNVENYKKQTQKILLQMPDYQTSSGGFSYWPDGKADLYVTAYALETAYRAKQAGYKVPSAPLEKAAVWLKGVFKDGMKNAYSYSMPEMKTMQAYAVYVLSLYGQRLDAQFNNLYGQRNALSTPAQGYLLLAAEQLNKEEEVKNNLAQMLFNQIVFEAQTQHFACKTAQPWLHMDDVKVTALTLQALLNSTKGWEQSYQAVRWLVQQLNPQGYWQNTNTNAAVFSALNAYYKLYEAGAPDFTATADLNGQNIFTARFEGRSTQTQDKQWPFKEIYTADNQARMKMSKTGQGRLYYSLAQSYAPNAYDKAVNAGFVISRKITDLQGQPVTEFHALQRYKVTLQTNTSAPYRFVVLEDFIPAGFELVNTSLATESQTDGQSLNNQAEYVFERDEKYDDRIAVFADYLPQGTHEYSYLVQATVAGKFSYPSAWASQMYDPAVFGRNNTTEIEIKP